MAETRYCDGVISFERVETAFTNARKELLASYSGHWESELPGSAFATAAAVLALALAQSASSQSGLRNFTPQITSALDWLKQHSNPDGGWGDTPESPSNALATTLCWAAFAADVTFEEKYAKEIEKAEAWLKKNVAKAGVQVNLDAKTLAAAFEVIHGRDQTLTVPVLAACALSGRFGTEEEAWKDVPQFPFEIVSLPRSVFPFLRLTAASHALSSMIAVGLVRYYHKRGSNPIKNYLRSSAWKRAVAFLDQIQPVTGGFLESTLLTSFVVMGLCGIGEADEMAAQRGLAFLLRSRLGDGSWPIDSNLDTRVSTLAMNSVVLGGERVSVEQLQDWLLDQQFGETHPGTNAAPGGWSWTHLPGGVPDAKDTADALLLLKAIEPYLIVTRTARRFLSVKPGVRWLLGLQNNDGGVSTFVKGRSKLAIDGSSPDVTAHALRAWLAWRFDLPMFKKQINDAVSRAVAYLKKTQLSDGSWPALWYGNGRSSEGPNFTCGTSRVILALAALNKELPEARGSEDMLKRAGEWLVKTQLADGGWAAGNGGEATVEETSWAVEGLAVIATKTQDEKVKTALERGTDWLVKRVASGQWKQAAPLGLHFARIGYSESLFPQIFTVAALGRVLALKTEQSKHQENAQMTER